MTTILQSTLFDSDVTVATDAPPKPETRAERLSAGRAARDVAIKRVSSTDNASAWIETALDVLIDLLRTNRVVATDDLWVALDEQGVDPPNERRSMAEVVIRAKRDGYMAPADWRQSSWPACKARPIRTYRSLICVGAASPEAVSE